MLDDTVQSVAY